MNLKQIAETLALEDLTPELPMDGAAAVDKAHASDLLSDVLANAPAGVFS